MDQQDAHEFLIFLLDWIDDEMIRTRAHVKKRFGWLTPTNGQLSSNCISREKLGKENPKQEFIDSFSDLPNLFEECTGMRKLYKENYSPQRIEQSLFDSNPFSGISEDLFQCQLCGSPTVRFTKFSTMSVTFDQNVDSLEQCLGKFTDPEQLEWTCESCRVTPNPGPKGLGYALKQNTILRPPEILCIHLQRLVGNGQKNGYWNAEKNSDSIEFPLKLDLYPFSSQYKGNFSCPGPTETSSRRKPPKSLHSKILFNLKAVVVHLGGAGGGHFIAFREICGPTKSSVLDDKNVSPSDSEDGDQSWIMISDSDSQPVSRETVRNQQAYMLFYEKEKK